MHDTAIEFGRAFLATYLPEGRPRVLDVGAQDINGSLRGCAPGEAVYVGVDMVAGKGVDIVLDDPHVLPFADGEFDAVVSTSCFEHDPMFWVTFLEILRVTKDGGHIYVNVPSNGWYHQHPVDNWRFYPEAGVSLRDWGRRQGYDVELLESFTGRRRHDVWNDCIMVFRRGEHPAPAAYIADLFPDAMNVRRGNTHVPVSNYCKGTEDQEIIRSLMQAVRSRDRQIAEMQSVIDFYEETLEMRPTI